ncbi:MAG: DNA polymerase Y family protein [Anaeromyxobacter sp.]
MRPERTPRVLALHLPDLALQRLLRGRAREEAPGEGLAVLEDGRVLCCDAAARAAGVRRGMSAAEAHAACGRLATVQADRQADRAALRALAEVLLGLAPAVEVALPDALLLDAGAAHVLAGRRAEGGADARAAGEQLLAERALAAVAEMGYAAVAALADGRAPARALAGQVALAPSGPATPGQAESKARGSGGGRILRVAPGGTAAALAALPPAALGLPPAVVARLAALGLDDAGALARLPEGTLAHRFGQEGVAAARLARAEDPSPLVPYVPQTLPEEALELEGPAEAAEPLLFALKRLADRVASRLAGRGLGASRLRLVLKLDPRGEERIDLPLAAPTAAAARWLAPLKEHLFSLRLPAAVVGLRLLAVEVAVVGVEQLAFGDRPEALAALEGVLARLSARLGDGALFAAEPVERYRPEGAYRPVAFRPPGRSAGRDGARAPGPGVLPGLGPRREGGAGGAAALASAGRPTRLLQAPEPVVAEGEGGRLTALRVGGRDRAVLRFEGPERLSGEWWSERFDCDYYRILLDGLGDCWVFRDAADGRLYLHGFFD